MRSLSLHPETTHRILGAFSLWVLVAAGVLLGGG